MAYLFKSVDRIKVYGVLTGGLAAGPRVNSVTGRLATFMKVLI